MVKTAPTVLVIRPEPKASLFCTALEDRLGRAVRVIKSPVMRIEPTIARKDFTQFKTLIFTSSSAVEVFAHLTEDRRFSCYVVGPATARSAVSHGFEVTQGGGDVTDLARRIQADDPRTPCLYLRGEHVARDLQEMLNSAGIETQQCVIYTQKEVSLTSEASALMDSDTPVILPVFSPRSAELFFDKVSISGAMHVVAISESAAHAVPRSKVTSVLISRAPNQLAMLDALEQVWSFANQLERNGSAQ